MFDLDAPIVMNYKDPKFKPCDVLDVNIRRPTRYGNPFVTGMGMTLQSVTTALGKVEYFDEVVTSDFIASEMPFLIEAIIHKQTLERKHAVLYFRLFWRWCRENGKITDEEVLSLKGKRLICCCEPKSCHGDVYVDDFILTYQP